MSKGNPSLILNDYRPVIRNPKRLWIPLTHLQAVGVFAALRSYSSGRFTRLKWQEEKEEPEEEDQEETEEVAHSRCPSHRHTGTHQEIRSETPLQPECAQEPRGEAMQRHSIRQDARWVSDTARDTRGMPEEAETQLQPLVDHLALE